jgi:uncharacterized protein with ParB-like and HNH nuclease domain
MGFNERKIYNNMQQATPYVDFELSGIGNVLKKYRLKVPVNQREYSWEEEHVLDLFSDLQNAIQQNLPIYFLGTIVLVQDEVPKVGPPLNL